LKFPSPDSRYMPNLPPNPSPPRFLVLLTLALLVWAGCDSGAKDDDPLLTTVLSSLPPNTTLVARANTDAGLALLGGQVQLPALPISAADLEGLFGALIPAGSDTVAVGHVATKLATSRIEPLLSQLGTPGASYRSARLFSAEGTLSGALWQSSLLFAPSIPLVQQMVDRAEGRAPSLTTHRDVKRLLTHLKPMEAGLVSLNGQLPLALPGLELFAAALPELRAVTVGIESLSTVGTSLNVNLWLTPEGTGTAVTDLAAVLRTLLPVLSITLQSTSPDLANGLRQARTSATAEDVRLELTLPTSLFLPQLNAP